MPDAVVLIGPMGAGKSSIGRRVAKRLGLTFTDTDTVIVREHGPIADLFASQGEAAFRRIERETVANALTKGGIIALGGGAVLAPETREALSHHHVVALTVSQRTIASRIRGSKRPLLNGGDPLAEWVRISEERRPLYESLADVTYDTSRGPLKNVVEEAAEWAAERLGVPLERKEVE
ncbi:MAG TPA: (d)CMP kinase [Candidatus Microbacterium stercoravium]|uniref:Shikimate kinase n=1 Tax=Candidatus Microbacterium stercoravium TaxID=2838697 RepID=A0A9D2H646_9MICO|nr:(d)CMP kinase [Candidatus Microbacterium stercoravium]